MEQITVRNLTFSYNNESRFRLDHLSFSVNKGEILLLIGESGCGKTTLLRHLKPDFMPQGERNREGEILLNGKSVSAMSEREQAGRIGFVRQNVESSQATDKVWHELAFGLESLGYPQSVMQRKVAEITAFFGLEGVYHEPLSNLSGGQKQLVNLASVMVMEPELLILDEPTSQLDPIAATEFFQMIGKINKELGITVLMTEHRLEEAFSLCDRIMVMEKGNILFEGLPEHGARWLYQENHSLYKALPVSARLYFELGGEDTGKIPLTVREGNIWITEFYRNDRRERRKLPEVKLSDRKGKKEIPQLYAFSAEELWFRYEREGKDILKACSIAPEKGKITAILGGNGAGKSTLLHVLAGHEVPFWGKVRKPEGRIGMLPQNPQAMFAKKTVLEELQESGKCGMQVGRDGGLQEGHGRQAELGKIAVFCGLEDILGHHPYDLSGGEMQKLALAKLLLSDYDILLLDEPGKGMDYAFKEKMGKCLQTLAAEGKTILLVSHDVDFCAQYADQCGLFFDGHVVSLENTRDFFMQNVFYTTAVRRMCKANFPEAVILEDVLEICGKENIPEDSFEICRQEDTLEDGLEICEQEDNPESSFETEDLEKTKDCAEEKKKELDGQGTYCDNTGLVEEMIVRQNHPKPMWIPIIIFFFVMPLTIYFGETVLQQRKYYFVSLLLIIEAIVSFVLSFERRRPKIREIMVVAMLCAITVTGRAAFYMVPNIKPMAALIILSGVGLGSETGFLVGAVSMLVSDAFFGQGPWTPWQMFAMGLLGFVAGKVFKQNTKVTTVKKYGICFFGFAAVMLIYGGIMNPASVFMYQENINWQMIVAAYSMGSPFDAIHAASTFAFLWIGTRPMLEKLERVKKKYGFYIELR